MALRQLENYPRTCNPDTRKLAERAIDYGSRLDRERHAGAEIALLESHQAQMREPALLARMADTLAYWRERLASAQRAKRKQA